MISDKVDVEMNKYLCLNFVVNKNCVQIENRQK